MFRQAFVAAAITAAVTAAAPAFAYTIGYVDTGKILMQYKGATSARSQMQHQLQQYQSEFAKRQKKIAEAQKAGKSPAEIQKMTEQYERELAPYKSRAQNLEQSLSADIKTKVEAKISAIAKRRGVDVVVDKAAVLYGGVDLTGDVLSALR